MKIPGLSEALDKLDGLPEKMTGIANSLKSTNEKLDRMVELLEQQIHQNK